MSSVRRIVASFLGAMALAMVCTLPVAAAPGPGDEIQLHAFSFRYQQALESIAIIQPLLSAHGTLELQPGSNTIVIRDTHDALSRIAMALRAFDHPNQALQLELLIVRASRGAVSPPAPSTLPDQLVRRLRQLLPYDSYDLSAKAVLSTHEGEAVSYNVSEDYEVSFRLGTLSEQRIKLTGFQVDRRIPRRAAGLPMIHTTLALDLDEPLCLGLARDEASRDAFMIVLTMHRGEQAPTRSSH
jgi:hypothetical protein